MPDLPDPPMGPRQVILIDVLREALAANHLRVEIAEPGYNGGIFGVLLGNACGLDEIDRLKADEPMTCCYDVECVLPNDHDRQHEAKGRHPMVIADQPNNPPTYWNGEPTPCIQGSAIVSNDNGFPLYWAADLVGQRIPVVRIFYGDTVRNIDDRDGSGWAKVTNGHGSPRYGHCDLSVRPGSFIPAVSDVR